MSECYAALTEINFKQNKTIQNITEPKCLALYYTQNSQVKEGDGKENRKLKDRLFQPSEPYLEVR